MFTSSLLSKKLQMGLQYYYLLTVLFIIPNTCTLTDASSNITTTAMSIAGLKVVLPSPPLISLVEDECLIHAPSNAAFGVVIDIAKDPHRSFAHHGRLPWFDGVSLFIGQVSRGVHASNLYAVILDGDNNTNSTWYYFQQKSDFLTDLTDITTTKSTSNHHPISPALAQVVRSALVGRSKGVSIGSSVNAPTSDFKFITVITDGAQRTAPSTYPAVPRLIIDIGGYWAAKVATVSYKLNDVVIIDNPLELTKLTLTVHYRMCQQVNGGQTYLDNKSRN